MKKYLLILCGVGVMTTLSAQTKIKDGTVMGSSSEANPNAILELESNNKGLLLPRVALDSTLLASPLAAHVAGMSVYNTATTADVTPGYYYNDGSRWVKISVGEFWGLHGNAGTDATRNFVGTTDSMALVFKTNGVLKVVSPVSPSLNFLAGDTAMMKDYMSSPLNVFNGGFATFNSTHNIYSINDATSSWGWTGSKAGGTVTAPTIPAANTLMSTTNGALFDGTDFVTVARMRMGADGAISATSLPTKITFLTTPQGSKVNLDRMSIRSNGRVKIGNIPSAPTALLDVDGDVRVRSLVAGAATDRVVVADTAGLLKAVPAASLTLEPWNVAGTTTKASLNNQHIYQNGNVGIKVTNPRSPLSIFDTVKVTELNGRFVGDVSGNPGTYYRGLIHATAPQSNLSYVAHASRTLLPSSLPALGFLFFYGREDYVDIDNVNFSNSALMAGNRTILNHRGISRAHSMAGIFNNFNSAIPVAGTRNQNNQLGIEASINIASNNLSNTVATGDRLFGRVAGTLSYASVAPTSGNVGLIDINYLRGSESLVQLNYSRFVSGTDPNSDVSGSLSKIQYFGGTVNVKNTYALNAEVDITNQGSYRLEDVAGLRTKLYINHYGSDSLVVKNLYGLFIEKEKVYYQPNAPIAFNNLYGVYIPAFRLEGDNAAMAYNIYSDAAPGDKATSGLTTKNYFGGRVGINQTAPEAKLHVVANVNDLTPAIMTGCREYADNAAALAAGLQAGALYRSGDVLKIVH